MKQLACGSVVPDCAAVFQAETEQQILKQVAVHARDEHGMEEVPPAVVRAVQDNIADV